MLNLFEERGEWMLEPQVTDRTFTLVRKLKIHLFGGMCSFRSHDTRGPGLRSRRYRIFELKELSCTTDERLVLIGDSAHAMTPQ